MNEVRTYHGKLVSREDLGLWQGDIVPVLDEVDAVDLRWKGGKIPPRILWECLAWFRLVNEKYQSEAQARLGYNPKTSEWCWVAFPQYVVAGLYSKEIPSDELTEEQRAMRLRATKEMADGGFMEAGTIHSHCDAGAFASGTDDKDEISQNGVHITLGKISSDRPEIHGRVVFRKIKYPIHWEDWLDAAPADIPESFCFGVKEVPIDEERLMGLCFEHPKPKASGSKRYSGTGWPSGGWSMDENPGLRGNRSGFGFDAWDDAGWDLSGEETEREREEDSTLEEFTDGTLDELFYGYGFGADPVLGFLRKFSRRVAELGVYSPKEVVSEVLDGLLGKRDSVAAASEPERKTAMDP